MQQSIAPGVIYGGVYTVETGYTDKTRFFETFNGEKPVMILSPNKTDVLGIVQSVNLYEEEGTIYFDPENSPVFRKKSQNKRLRKRNMPVKKNRRKR